MKKRKFTEKTQGAATKLEAMKHLQNGMNYKQEGRVHSALEAFKKAIAYDPTYKEAYQILGTTLGKEGLHEDAIDYFSKAIQLDAQDVDFHYNLAYTYEMQGSLNEAILYYNKAIKLDSACVDAHNNLANIYRQQNNHDEAISHLQNCIKIDPRHIEAHYNLARTWMDVDQHERAVHQLQKVIQIKPTHHDAQYNLAVCYEHMGRINDSINMYKTITDTHVAHVTESYINWGLLLCEQHKYAEAAEKFAKATRESPDHVDAFYNKALAYELAGNLPEAIAAYVSVLHLAPEDVTAEQKMNELVHKWHGTRAPTLPETSVRDTPVTVDEEEVGVVTCLGQHSMSNTDDM